MWSFLKPIGPYVNFLKDYYKQRRIPIVTDFFKGENSLSIECSDIPPDMNLVKHACKILIM